MFAALPPLVRIPAASRGYPIHSLNQSRTASSTALGPADRPHEPTSMFSALAMRSPSAPGHVPQPGMYAK